MAIERPLTQIVARDLLLPMLYWAEERNPGIELDMQVDPTTRDIWICGINRNTGAKAREPLVSESEFHDGSYKPVFKQRVEDFATKIRNLAGEAA